MLSVLRNRYFRTIFLAVVATLTFVGSAIFIFDVEPTIMLNFFLASVVGLFIIIAAAFIFNGIRVLVRKWMS